MKGFMLKYGNIVASIALLITTLTVNSTCIWASYQPELPENAKKLRKF